MKRILISLLMLVSMVALAPAFAADGGKPECAKATAGCCETSCRKCAEVCQATLDYCLKKGGKHASAEHIARLKDCIALCKASADLDSRNSKLKEKVRAICLEACTSCAASCEKFDDKQMKSCATTCRECASSCKGEARKKG